MPRVQIGDAEDQPIPLELDVEGRLKLPSIVVRPSDRNDRAHVKRVEVSVFGDPTGVLTLQAAYPFPLYDGPGLQVIEPEPLSFLPYAVSAADRTITPGRYILKAEVFVQQPANRQGEKPGPLRTLNAERTLEVGTLSTCTLRAVWKHQELVIGETNAELEITAEHLPRGILPMVAVLDPKGVLTESMRQAINQQLKTSPPQLDGAHVPEGRTTFKLAIQHNITFAEMETAMRKAASDGPIPVELRISAPREGSRPVDLAGCNLTGKSALRVDFKENIFPGFPIMDLGTSTTYALLYFSGHRTSRIPTEQEQLFRRTLQEWFGNREGWFATPPWREYLQNAAAYLARTSAPSNRTRLLATTDPAQALSDYLREGAPPPGAMDQYVHAVLRALEASAAVPTLPMDFKLALRQRLSSLYTQAFRRFPLEAKRLLVVDLEPEFTTGGETQNTGMVEPIPSTTAVLTCEPLKLEVGPQAAVARIEAAIANPASLLSQFHSSPKIYYPLLGQPLESVLVSTQGIEPQKIPARKFLVAALCRLRERVEAFCKRSGLPHKRFNKLVMPFPTSAPLRVRRELLEAAREAGFDRPTAELDEALSAAVFYLVNPFGADEEMGLEAFRASCRPISRGEGMSVVKWVQTLLLIDIGGGTTDIALIEVVLTDLEAPGAGDGSRGRYYQMTPRLLGTTGRSQLAGNLLTLGVFHALKKRIADVVLTTLASQSNPSEGEGIHRLMQVATEVPALFRDSANRYRSGSILKEYQVNSLWNDNRQAPGGSLAFHLVNKVLPTRWDGVTDAGQQSACARRFYSLWQIADRVKVQVFGNPSPGSSGETSFTLTPEILAPSPGLSGKRSFALTPEDLAGLLDLQPAEITSLNLPAIALGADAFRQAVESPLEEIANLALALVTDCLPGDAQKPRILDRVILTGQTCRLDLVREIVTSQFQRECELASSTLRWNPTALTFEGEYAKQAAAIGAGFAEYLSERRIPPSVIAPLNSNVLHVDIQNLFFYLQSSLHILQLGADHRRVLIKQGSEFTEFDSNGVGYLRSAWDISPTEKVDIWRVDYPTDSGTHWGQFDCKSLAENIGMTEFRDFQHEVRMAIETDHRLVVSMLLCRGNEVHYKLPASTEYLDVGAKISELKLLPAGESGNWRTRLVGWTLGINMQTSHPAKLFVLSDPFDTVFRTNTSNSGEVRRSGRVSIELPPCPENGEDRFYLRQADPTQDWIEIGKLRRPESKQRHSIRAILDEQGQLRIHQGELPLWTATDDCKLKDSGTVLRKPLANPGIQPDDLRNPFCGKH